LAIGLALQGTLQNIAAGIMLLVLRPLRVGEYIETGSIKGFIIEIGLFATEMKTVEGLYLMAPNSTLWNTPITNHSREQERRQELSVAIGNDVDAVDVKKKIIDIVIADDRVQKEPAPKVFSDDLTADKTVLTLQYWAKTSKWSETRHDMIDRLKQGLTDAGIALK
jgi:small conductance mechanosensitive channel